MHVLLLPAIPFSGVYYVSQKRGGTSVGRFGMDGMDGMEWKAPKKEPCFIPNDDGLRLHCEKTKKALYHTRAPRQVRESSCRKGDGSEWQSPVEAVFVLIDIDRGPYMTG